ncbi:MAG: aldose 1-epimerase family protein [Candidatus Hydrogenedentales bacterium]
MQLYGKNYSVTALRKRIGAMDQVAGIQMVSLADGNERPGRAAIFRTGSGLEFTVLIDRGMDIGAASHYGRAMGWQSPTGHVAPQYFEPEGFRWLRSFHGGLLTTCGLSRAGGPSPNSALDGSGLHGRISNIPAKNVQVSQTWEGNTYWMRLSGTLRETSVFGENLTLTRTISAALGESKFFIHDTLTNEGFKKTGVMLLYHCNIGWPALDKGSRILAPCAMIAPRDDAAKKGMENWAVMDAPTANYQEKCYYHDLTPDRNGKVTVAMINDGFPDKGFGVYVTYNKKELPRFVQWKQMGEQEYVCGFEPCLCTLEGREKEEELGLLSYLKAGESRSFQLEFGTLTEADEVKALERKASQPVFVDHYSAFDKKC